MWGGIRRCGWSDGPASAVAVATEGANEQQVRREDVLISLVEVAKENWSFGNGIAQYA